MNWAGLSVPPLETGISATAPPSPIGSATKSESVTPFPPRPGIPPCFALFTANTGDRWAVLENPQRHIEIVDGGGGGVLGTGEGGVGA